MRDEKERERGEKASELLGKQEAKTNQGGLLESLAKVDQIKEDGPTVRVCGLGVQVHAVDFAEEAAFEIVLEPEREKEENGRFVYQLEQIGRTVDRHHLEVGREVQGGLDDQHDGTDPLEEVVHGEEDD